jgi:hypothetical protein
LTNYNRLVSLKDETSRTQLLELVLFKLSHTELFQLGVTEVDQPDGPEWSIAWSSDSGEAAHAIYAALETVDVGAGVSCNHGFAGWYVPKKDFFKARKALLARPELETLGVKIVTPNFTLP